MDEQVYDPVEVVPITLFNGAVLAVRSSDGPLWIAVQDLATTVDVNPRSQRRRVQTNPLLQRYARWFRVATPGGEQTQVFLQLESIGLWLMTISVSKAPEEIRARLVWLQQYLEQAVRTAFAEATGLPERSSDIEDIDDIGRVDDILQGIVTQQQQIAGNHDALQEQIATINARLRALESQRPKDVAVLSKAQRGQVYHMVVAWSDLLQARNEGMTVGGARAACWTAIKRKFGVAQYADIPAAHYNEAVAFIRTAAAKLGGDVGAQTMMDMSDNSDE